MFCNTAFIQHIVQTNARGVLKFGFGRDVPLRNLKEDPYKYQFFKKKWPIHTPICSILGQFSVKSPDFVKIFLNLSQFWFKFGKINPFIYQILHFIRGHSYTKRLILLPMLVAHPHRIFCTESPLHPDQWAKLPWKSMTGTLTHNCSIVLCLPGFKLFQFSFKLCINWTNF